MKNKFAKNLFEAIIIASVLAVPIQAQAKDINNKDKVVGTSPKDKSMLAIPTQAKAKELNNRDKVIGTSPKAKELNNKDKVIGKSTKDKFISDSHKVVNTSLIEAAQISDPTQIDRNEVGYSTTKTVDSLSGLESVIKSNMYNRNTNFVVKYKGNSSNLKGNISQIINNVLDKDDYLKYSYSGYGFNYTGYSNDVTINFSFKYLTTKAQEDFVDSKVKSILSQIITPNMTDAQKEKSIHDYIVKNVQYDTSLERHSAYNALAEGKTVCQGYALLTYKMLNSVGIENKIVIGAGNNGGSTESHAWNLVKLNGNWYHLDCTWDDPIPDVKGRVRYDYYNVTDSKMGMSHTWDHSAYPAATKVYK